MDYKFASKARANPSKLSDASVLGKLLVLPANVKLGRKRIAWYQCSSLFGLDISYEEKRFLTLIPGLNIIQLFSLHH
jgi:hypothetical protein